VTEIAYETLPIGQPGTFVLSERQRIDGEMGKLKAENRHLKQMLVNNWRQVQSNGAALIQWGQDQERTAAMYAKHLEELGVPLDVNVFAVE
jgi:hypothetical protein